MTSSSDRTKRLLAVEARMPLHSEWALTRFVAVNPHWQGAHWADVLDVLDDSDSNLEVTEPIYEALCDILTPEQRPYINLVALTLLWADRDHEPSPFDVHGMILMAIEEFE